MRLLVFVAAMIPAPGESAEDMFANTGYARAEQGGSSDLAIFYHDVDPTLAAEALAKGRRQSQTPARNLGRWPRGQTFRRDSCCVVTIAFFLGRGPSHRGRSPRHRPRRIDSGHTPALSHPRELIRPLEAYRAEVGEQIMLTVDDVRSIPLFSTLPVAELELLAETSADLHLGAGEFAVPEGGDRALYAVLTGKIEVVKLFDGIERTLGWRVTGTIFGEVPIAFGTVFVGGYRASEPSRVFRVDPKHYYAVAAKCPDVAAKVGALARERIGGLQGIAAEPPKARVAMVGNPCAIPHATRCASSSRATRLPMTG